MQPRNRSQSSGRTTPAPGPPRWSSSLKRDVPPRRQDPPWKHQQKWASWGGRSFPSPRGREPQSPRECSQEHCYAAPRHQRRAEVSRHIPVRHGTLRAPIARPTRSRRIWQPATIVLMAGSPSAPCSKSRHPCATVIKDGQPYRGKPYRSATECPRSSRRGLFKCGGIEV